MPNSRPQKRNIKVILVQDPNETSVPWESLQADHITLLFEHRESETLKHIAAGDVSMVIIRSNEMSKAFQVALGKMSNFKHRTPPPFCLQKQDRPFTLVQWSAFIESKPSLIESSSDLLNLLKNIRQGSRQFLNAHRIENSGYDEYQAYDDYKEIVAACQNEMQKSLEKAQAAFNAGNIVKTKHWLHKLRNCTTYLSTERADKSTERLEKKPADITPEKLLAITYEVGAAIESAELFLHAMEIGIQGY